MDTFIVESQHRRGVVKLHTVFYTGGGLNQTQREVTQYHYNIKNIFMPFQLHGIIFGDLDFRLGILYVHLLHRYHLFLNQKHSHLNSSQFFHSVDLEFNFSST